MTHPDFAAALASALLPGGRLAHGITTPAAGDVLDPYSLAHWLASPAAQPALDVLRVADASFQNLSEQDQQTALQQAERHQPAAFATLVSGLLRHYYQHPKVIAAFGWRTTPPQPQGHELTPCDPALFDSVAARGPIWRADE